MPKVVDPMAAQLAAGIPPDEERYGFEFKWDGVRAVTFWDGRTLGLQTRNRNDVTPRYPELAPLAQALGARQVVLDGEIVALDERGRPSFETLQQRMGLTADADVRRVMAKVPVSYILFDLIYLDGQLLDDEIYTRRREWLEELQMGGAAEMYLPIVPAVTDGLRLRSTISYEIAISTSPIAKKTPP
jgi:bifunctional non-homologous end joining protein LigD